MRLGLGGRGEIETLPPRQPGPGMGWLLQDGPRLLLILVWVLRACLFLGLSSGWARVKEPPPRETVVIINSSAVP